MMSSSFDEEGAERGAASLSDCDDDDDDDDNEHEEEADDDAEDDPLDQLKSLGFAGGEAVAALMQCGGDVEQAKQQLSSASSSSKKSETSSNSNSKTKGGRNKKKNKSSNGNSNSCNNNNSINGGQEGTGIESTATAATSSSNGSNSSDTNNRSKTKSFKEQRKQELRFQKALRDRRRACRVCGGPHPRKECPGIADDGRGHSRHSGTRAKKKETAKRREFQAQKTRDGEFLQLGVWTREVPYWDGFADLVQLYYNNQRTALQFRQRSSSMEQLQDTAGEDQPEESNRNATPSATTTSPKEGLARWILDWAQLNVKLGEDPIHTLTPEQRKIELKTWSGSKLQKTARALLPPQDSAAVDAALKDRNPRSALIQILLAAPSPAADKDDAGPPERTLHVEWPGYRGCVAPFSVLDDNVMYALEQLEKFQRENDDTTTASGVKALLALPPEQVAKWMVVDHDDDAATDAVPIDLCYFTRETQEMERTQAASKRAQEQQRAATSKKGRASAEAEVVRLRKVMAAQQARTVNSDEVLQGAANARLNPSALTSLHEALDRSLAHEHGSTRNRLVVIGVSCGLNYDTPEARHPFLGNAVRMAQKAVCQHAIEAAVKRGLPIVLECRNDSTIKESENKQVDFSSGTESASSDLVRILVEAAPPETTLLLRNGSLTTASKPGLPKLLETWPNLYVGMTAALAYSKCPKELLNVAYDLPLNRLWLTSEAPVCLPPVLSGSHLVDDCLPPHVACISETVADIKNGTSTASREEILQRSSELVSRVLGCENRREYKG